MGGTSGKKKVVKKMVTLKPKPRPKKKKVNREAILDGVRRRALG